MKNISYEKPLLKVTSLEPFNFICVSQIFFIEVDEYVNTGLEQLDFGNAEEVVGD